MTKYYNPILEQSHTVKEIKTELERLASLPGMHIMNWCAVAKNGEYQFCVGKNYKKLKGRGWKLIAVVKKETV